MPLTAREKPAVGSTVFSIMVEESGIILSFVTSDWGHCAGWVPTTKVPAGEDQCTVRQ